MNFSNSAKLASPQRQVVSLTSKALSEIPSTAAGDCEQRCCTLLSAAAQSASNPSLLRPCGSSSLRSCQEPPIFDPIAQLSATTFMEHNFS